MTTSSSFDGHASNAGGRAGRCGGWRWSHGRRDRPPHRCGHGAGAYRSLACPAVDRQRARPGTASPWSAAGRSSTGPGPRLAGGGAGLAASWLRSGATMRAGITIIALPLQCRRFCRATAVLLCSRRWYQRPARRSACWAKNTARGYRAPRSGTRAPGLLHRIDAHRHAPVGGHLHAGGEGGRSGAGSPRCARSGPRPRPRLEGARVSTPTEMKSTWR